MNQQVNFRLSAYQTGDRANPRYVWGVGIPLDVVEELPVDQRRVQLEADDERLYIKFNGKGISLNKPNPGSTMMWSSHIGAHHLNGIAPPDEVQRARGVTGTWDAENKRIVVEDVPEIAQRAMQQSVHHTPATQQQFPATHFSEDVAEAREQNEFAQAAASFKRSDATTTVDSVVEEAALESDPNSPTYQWFLAQVKKGQELPFAEVVELTPELADILLRRNAGNRNIRTAKLNQYVSDIVNDRWQLNGEQIQVSREGELNNGQHRCSAVLAANKPIRTFMAFGLSRESRTTVDVGANRRPGDHLAVMGYKNTTSLAGLARFVLAYEQNERRDLSWDNRITSAAINERVPNDPLLEEDANFTASNQKLKRLAPPSVTGFCYYEFSKIDPVAAKDFLASIISGAGLNSSDPAYLVRETLISRPQLSRELKVEVFFRGWNAFRQGKQLRSIRILYELPQLV